MFTFTCKKTLICRYELTVATAVTLHTLVGEGKVEKARVISLFLPKKRSQKGYSFKALLPWCSDLQHTVENEWCVAITQKKC